jgi:hypothetical protein
MNRELTPRNDSPPAVQAVEQEARAVQEIQASLIIAKRFPRDEEAARAGILMACKRLELAERAIYAYPRGGTSVTGPSIRLAEEIARHWGNLDYGLREIDRRPGISVMEAYCWDMQANVRARRQFEVPHVRYTRKGSTNLDDPRDIYEMTANMGARRLRACILEVIPGHVAGEAEEACRQTMAGGADGVPIQDRAVKMVEAFQAYGVTQTMIETFLGHKLSALSEPELVRLREVYNSMRDGYSNRDQWFDSAAAGTSEQAEDLKAKLAAKGKAETPREKPAPEVKANAATRQLIDKLRACKTKEALVKQYNEESFIDLAWAMQDDQKDKISEAYGDLILEFEKTKRAPKGQGELPVTK